MFLQPWIGENCLSGINNEKILILGESHYYEGEPFDNTQDVSDFTAKALQDIITKRTWIKFFNYVGQLFSDDWTEIWKNVAFANLIQHVLEKGEQPDAEHIKTVKTFYTYLELLKPDKVIVVSSRAWKDWFRKHVDNEEGVELIEDAKIGISSVFKFPHSTGESLVIGINHTSSREGNYVENWKPTIDEFLLYKLPN